MFNTLQRRRVMIVGAGDMGQRLAAQIQAQPYLGLMLVGLLDDDPLNRTVMPEALDSLAEVRDMVNQLKVDDVVITLPRSTDLDLDQLVAELHDLPLHRAQGRIDKLGQKSQKENRHFGVGGIHDDAARVGLPGA